MRHRFAFAVLFTLCLSAPLLAQTYTITPDRGPVAGGTQVTIKGEFGPWPYGVIFGSVGVPATRVDGTTLIATTPAHLPGEVPITIFEYDIGITTSLTFTFIGETERTFERLLLPVFTQPVIGAFGSEFHTDLSVSLTQDDRVDIYGLERNCFPMVCASGPDVPFTLTTSSPNAVPMQISPAGTPGQFIYVPEEQLHRVAMNLRAYDTSRADENFGTEIPIVAEDEFFGSDETVALLGIPADPRFRKTLRIYTNGHPEGGLTVTIDGGGTRVEHAVQVRPGTGLFDPGYAEFSKLPDGRRHADGPHPPQHPPPARGRFAGVGVHLGDEQRDAAHHDHNAAALGERADGGGQTAEDEARAPAGSQRTGRLEAGAPCVRFCRLPSAVCPLPRRGRVGGGPR